MIEQYENSEIEFFSTDVDTSVSKRLKTFMEERDLFCDSPYFKDSESEWFDCRHDEMIEKHCNSFDFDPHHDCDRWV